MSTIEKGVPPRLRRGRHSKYLFDSILPDTWFRVATPPSEQSLRTYVSKRAKELGMKLQVLKQKDGSFIVYREAE